MLYLKVFLEFYFFIIFKIMVYILSLHIYINFLNKLLNCKLKCHSAKNNNYIIR